MFRIGQTYFPLFLTWLLLCGITTIFTGMVYVSVQQNFRQGANDPQIALAQDAARELAAGEKPASVIRDFEKRDIGASLYPYLIVYDEDGTPIAGSGELHGKLPVLPPGVFSYAKRYGENRFTWQPEEAVRSAVVLDSYNGIHSGFVMSGRSLREVEQREGMLTLHVFFLWSCAILLISLWGIVMAFFTKKD